MSNVATLPKTYPDNDDVQPSLRGKAIEQPMRVRFVAELFSPRFCPEFPYVTAGITPNGVVFTAIVSGVDLNSVREQIADAFGNEAVIHSIDIGVDRFDERDGLPGARVYGTTYTSRKRGFWAHVFPWLG